MSENCHLSFSRKFWETPSMSFEFLRITCEKWKCRCAHRNMNVASKSISSNCNYRVYRNSFLPFLSFLSFHDLSPRFCNLEPIVSFLHSFLLLLHDCINCNVEQQNYYLKRDYLAIFCISFYWQRGPIQKKRRDYYLKKSPSNGILHQSHRKWMLWPHPNVYFNTCTQS